MSSYTAGGSVLNEAFRRSMDPAKDTIASFRYFGIDDNMEKTRAPSAEMSEKQSKPSANANLSATTVDTRVISQGTDRATRVASSREHADQAAGRRDVIDLAAGADDERTWMAGAHQVKLDAVSCNRSHLGHDHHGRR